MRTFDDRTHDATCSQRRGESSGASSDRGEGVEGANREGAEAGEGDALAFWLRCALRLCTTIDSVSASELKARGMITWTVRSRDILHIHVADFAAAAHECLPQSAAAVPPVSASVQSGLARVCRAFKAD